MGIASHASGTTVTTATGTCASASGDSESYCTLLSLRLRVRVPQAARVSAQVPTVLAAHTGSPARGATGNASTHRYINSRMLWRHCQPEWQAEPLALILTDRLVAQAGLRRQVFCAGRLAAQAGSHRSLAHRRAGSLEQVGRLVQS